MGRKRGTRAVRGILPTQRDVLRDVMLTAGKYGAWMTLRELARLTRYGETTRQVGLPACRALIAFGRGNDTLAINLLASLPALAHRLGGSHAQRDVLNLTLLKALGRTRRPAHRLRSVPLPIAAWA